MYKARVEFCRSLCDLLPSHDFCDLCDRVIHIAGLSAHMQGVHGELLQVASLKIQQELPKMPCGLCHRTFLCYSALERHTLMAHDIAMRDVYLNYFKGTRKMICGYCGETERNIIDHLLERHGKQITVSLEMIQCPRCPLQFEVSQHYEEHIQEHCRGFECSEEET
ncbi:zinc finger, C2H2 type [Ancylostoma caninum]|uniref:Zinc finger, C2H2 type n=1 Tax=Ancylostoma caninum TaxID=29170 RepID=A0A368FIZ3_ANCCA|nr:zinc finger, C2H2 type [Ancylostoma caninum]